MDFIVLDDYDQMSLEGAQVFASRIREKPDSVLGFATGGTPVGLYEALIGMHREGTLDFSKITTFNLDEYYPMSHNDARSYHTFMWEHLFSSINVRRENVNIPDGQTADPEAFCDAYEEKIRAMGGIDLQLLGVGHNGHIAFNEPADALSARTSVVTLTDSTVDANARFFGNRDLVPRRALSMGMSAILCARRILVLVSGADKAPVVRRMRSGQVSTQVPASLLQLHPNTLVLLDRAAAGIQ